MRILFLHNKYQIGGGEDVSTRAEIDLLIKRGHEIEYIEADNRDIENISKIDLVKDTIWSKKYYDIVDAKLKEKKFDIVHVQNFFPQISPSVLQAAKDNNVKTVMSVRNYRLICPNALNFVNGKICTACVGKMIPYPALTKNCYKDDFAATSVVVAMLSYHNFKDTWNKNIDALIAVSAFVKSQLVEGKINADKISVKYNFVSIDKQSSSVPLQDNYLYVGRLSAEKGIDVLLEAFSAPALRGCKLKIIGDGPLTDLVKSHANTYDNIEYLNKLPLNLTYNEMEKAKALIFPSKWNEPFGRTIVEAFAHGTPVIGSTLGGIKEIIVDGNNGLLFDPFDSKNLIDKVLQMENDVNVATIRANARQSYYDNFCEDVAYASIMSIYENVLSKTVNH